MKNKSKLTKYWIYSYLVVGCISMEIWIITQPQTYSIMTLKKCLFWLFALKREHKLMLKDIQNHMKEHICISGQRYHKSDFPTPALLIPLLLWPTQTYNPLTHLHASRCSSVLIRGSYSRSLSQGRLSRSCRQKCGGGLSWQNSTRWSEYGSGPAS